MLKLYLCGKITGDDKYPEKFLEAENKLFEAGFYPVNPAVISSAGWNDAMRQAIGLMLQCDGVAMLADWKESRGATIEVTLAGDLGIPAKPLSDWTSGNQDR
jgi:hypothetical protein